MPSRVRRSSLAALVVLSLLLLPSPSWAQQTQAVSSGDPEHGVGIGIKGGPLFATFESSLAANPFENRTGLIGGLFIGGNRPGRVGVMVEILYAKKSATTDGDALDLYYLEVPVLVRVNFGSSDIDRGVAGYVIAGPAVNLNLKARQANFDVKNNVEAADLEIHFGGGVEISRFILEGRFMKGVRNIGKDLDFSEEIKTKAFALMFGVRFN